MDRNVTHATFTLERSYPVPPAGADLITVSLTTVEFTPAEDGGTRLFLTEQGAYLDGQEQPAWREQGTADQLDALAAELKADG